MPLLSGTQVKKGAAEAAREAALARALNVIIPPKPPSDFIPKPNFSHLPSQNRVSSSSISWPPSSSQGSLRSTSKMNGSLFSQPLLNANPTSSESSPSGSQKHYWNDMNGSSDSRETKRMKTGNEVQPTSPEFSVVDESWELTDPNPDIHALFVAFNRDFFFSCLGAAEVKWSKRMTSCAGTCSFSPRGGSCVITLSEPLLKLRPRKDLVETLLHEMIHGYLFLYNGSQDREAHGPLFLENMRRINKLTGANISVYHSFHNEVAHFQTHWWRCQGPCKDRQPYFGFVKRSMNRAPGPYDRWWKDHQSACGGVYVKIREPAPKPEPALKPKPKPGPMGKRSIVPAKSNHGVSASGGMAKLFGLHDVHSPPSTDSSSYFRDSPFTSNSSASGGAVGSNPDDSEWEDYRLFEEYGKQAMSNNENDDSVIILDDDE